MNKRSAIYQCFNLLENNLLITRNPAIRLIYNPQTDIFGRISVKNMKYSLGGTLTISPRVVLIRIKQIYRMIVQYFKTAILYFKHRM